MYHALQLPRGDGRGPVRDCIGVRMRQNISGYGAVLVGYKVLVDRVSYLVNCFDADYYNKPLPLYLPGAK
jgi:hypothetical protein